MNDSNRVYLDWAAATPLLPEAKAAMLPYLESEYANPSAIHQEGVKARQAVEIARERIARAIQLKPEYVTFTSGGTEANNLGIFGLLDTLARAGTQYTDMEVVTTKIEHPSLTRAFHRLETMGLLVKYVSVKENGQIDIESLREQVSERTVLFATSYINSEIGTIQPLHALFKVLKQFEEQHETQIFTLVDAAQAPLWLSCQFDSVGADVLTLDFGKCQGPKGVGALVQSKRVDVSAVTFGGGQESGLRPGTENVAGVVGAAEAFVWAQGNWRERAEPVRAVRNEAIAHIQSGIPQVIINGAEDDQRVANNINISIPGLDTEFTTIVLDTAGFAVSTKSACSGAGGGESTVVREISDDPARASSTLRITLGPDTTIDQLKAFVEVLKTHCEKAKAFD